mgnify:CR=1 FL=1
MQHWIQLICTGRSPLAWTAGHIKRPRHIQTINISRCVLLIAPSPPSLPCSRQCSPCWRLQSSAMPCPATVSRLSESSTRSCPGPAAVAPGQFHDHVPCSLRCCRGGIKASAASVFFIKCRWAACTQEVEKMFASMLAGPLCQTAVEMYRMTCRTLAVLLLCCQHHRLLQ